MFSYELMINPWNCYCFGSGGYYLDPYVLSGKRVDDMWEVYSYYNDEIRPGMWKIKERGYYAIISEDVLWHRAFDIPDRTIQAILSAEARTGLAGMLS